MNNNNNTYIRTSWSFLFRPNDKKMVRCGHAPSNWGKSTNKNIREKGDKVFGYRSGGILDLKF